VGLRLLSAIRPYRAESDAEGVRACVVALQDYERGLEPALPAGNAMADVYVARMFERCAKWDGVVFVAESEAATTPPTDAARRATGSSAPLIGFVSVWARVPQDEPDEPEGDYAFISDLVVLPASRGRGVGTALLAAAERHARSRGAATLKIGVLARNRDARRLYERVGFLDYRLQLTKSLR
jgi:ribosomal protein S18 acetylase RimI-like enzyme